MGAMASQITSLSIVYLLSRLFGGRSKKTPKLCVTGLCEGNSPGLMNSPHKWPVFPFDDVIMGSYFELNTLLYTLNMRQAVILTKEDPWQKFKPVTCKLIQHLSLRKLQKQGAVGIIIFSHNSVAEAKWLLMSNQMPQSHASHNFDLWFIRSSRIHLKAVRKEIVMI